MTLTRDVRFEEDFELGLHLLLELLTELLQVDLLGSPATAGIAHTAASTAAPLARSSRAFPSKGQNYKLARGTTGKVNIH